MDNRQQLNRDQLQAAYPMPEDAEVRASIASIKSTTSEARTLLNTGRIEAALTLATEAADRAQEINFPPARAEALLVRGRAEATSGAGENATKTLYDATSGAVLSRDRELIARTWLELTDVQSEFADDIREAFAANS